MLGFGPLSQQPFSAQPAAATSTAGILVVQSATAFTANYVTSSTIAPAAAVAAGNFLLLWISTSAAAANNVTGVTDINNNTWVKVGSDRQGGRTGDWWYVQSAAGGTPTITITSTNFITRAIVLRELSGVASATPIDVFAYALVAASLTPTATATTTNANDLIVGAAGIDKSATVYTLGAGYSNLSQANGADFLSAAMESKLVTSTGLQTANFTIDSPQGGIMGIIAIKAAAGGAAPVGSTGRIKVYNGTAFVAKPVKVWNGTAWVVKPVKRWNGTLWVVTPY